MRVLAGVAVVAARTAAFVRAESEPNPPAWPPSVNVFSPEDGDIQSVLDAAFAKNGGHDPPNNGQFSDARCGFSLTLL
jgi:hypothetical protein